MRINLGSILAAIKPLEGLAVKSLADHIAAAKVDLLAQVKAPSGETVGAEVTALIIALSSRIGGIYGMILSMATPLIQSEIQTALGANASLTASDLIDLIVAALDAEAKRLGA